ncbi:hypothetical protein BH23CHL8_BH23CHL8_01770 [soil metagenome]
MARVSRTRIWALAFVLALVALPQGAAVAAEKVRPSAVPNAWGWLVARKPSTFAYVPGPRDQGNSGGHTDRVQRTRIGLYEAYFNQIGNGFYPIGVVTAISPGPRTCMIDDNGGNSVGGDPLLYIDCFDRNGQAADARYVANIVLGGDGPTGTLGYTWADQEATPDYEPADYYSYLSSGAGPITVHRSATGSYEVRMPGLGRRGGNAQVSAAKGGPAALCKVQALLRDGPDELIKVRCRDAAGPLVDADFMVIFTHRVGLTGVQRSKAAYLLADRPSAGSYVPQAKFRYSSAGKQSRVERVREGRYRVTLPGMARGGSAQVTAYGAGAAICQLTSIRKDRLPQRIGVACFDPSGAPTDSRFMLSYTR